MIDLEKCQSSGRLETVNANTKHKKETKMKYKILPNPGEYRTKIQRIQLLGFDTDHPSVVVYFKTKFGTEDYGEYIPLDNPKVAVRRLHAVLTAHGDAKLSGVSNSERPLTDALNYVLPMYVTPRSPVCAGRLRVVRGRNARGALVAKYMWGNGDPIQHAAKEVSAMDNPTPDDIIKVLKSYGLS